jgi:hypothetical protein
MPGDKSQWLRATSGQLHKTTGAIAQRFADGTAFASRSRMARAEAPADATPGHEPVVSIDGLVATVESGSAILFTGAGFSSGACSVDGAPLPDSAQMLDELWSLCFGSQERDDSTLCDLYDVALSRMPDQLQAYIERRLRIGDAELPPYLARWFAAPWRRVYTLNVDDLELAISRQYELPRPLRSRSAPAASFAAAAVDDGLPVIHLNGVAGGSASELTFSTLQYAARLCGRDPGYTALVEDLMQSPFVFAGTTLDEVVLWQHVEMKRRSHGHDIARSPRSYLITPSLSRARRVLLESMGISWVRSTVEAVAEHLPRWPIRRRQPPG